MAGAAGSAILIAAMSVGLSGSLTGGATEAAAQADGTRIAFVVGSVLAVAAVVVSFTIRPRPAQR